MLADQRYVIINSKTWRLQRVNNKTCELKRNEWRNILFSDESNFSVLIIGFLIKDVFPSRGNLVLETLLHSPKEMPHLVVRKRRSKLASQLMVPMTNTIFDLQL